MNDQKRFQILTLGGPAHCKSFDWPLGHGEDPPYLFRVPDFSQVSVSCYDYKDMNQHTISEVHVYERQRVLFVLDAIARLYRWKERSRTFQGIADAIASQWFLE